MAGPVESAVLLELGDRAESALGQVAVALARRLDSAEDHQAAAMARELRILISEIMKWMAPSARSDLDELRARRASRGAVEG